MADPRIIDVTLDERTILWRSADIEQERRIAIFDLIEENSFAPQRAYPDGYAGPYRIALSVPEGRASERAVPACCSTSDSFHSRSSMRNWSFGSSLPSSCCCRRALRRGDCPGFHHPSKQPDSRSC